MIAFTDREVPLTQLGKNSKRGPSQNDGTAEPEGSEAEPQAELTLIFCYRNAVGISRKVDPEVPLPIQQQRIEADQLLAYDRRTGDFLIPGKGKVYLYDRGDKPSQTEETNAEQIVDQDVDDHKSGSPRGQRTVTQTSARTTNGGRATTRGRATATPNPAKPRQQAIDTEPTASQIPTMVLTQIHFNNGMRGRLGSGKENDKTEHALVGILRQR